ncbi:MAG: hypothetical protein ACI4U2_06040, partial [Christensenellaceae bacterium]
SRGRDVSCILRELLPGLRCSEVQPALRSEGDRVILELDLEDCYEYAVRDVIAEKAAEVICIAYKYEFLSGMVKVALPKREREILITELIAADLPEELPLVNALVAQEDLYQIDGFCRFRLKSLRKKWERIANCIPTGFTEEKLADFIGYVMEGNHGMLYIREGEVYDGEYRKLTKAKLFASDPFSRIREVILSGADKVFCLSALPEQEMGFLQKYYARRVYFA